MFDRLHSTLIQTFHTLCASPKMGESTPVSGVDFSIFGFEHIHCYKKSDIKNVVANSVDPDETSPYETS